MHTLTRTNKHLCAHGKHGTKTHSANISHDTFIHNMPYEIRTSKREYMGFVVICTSLLFRLCFELQAHKFGRTFRSNDELDYFCCRFFSMYLIICVIWFLVDVAHSTSDASVSFFLQPFVKNTKICCKKCISKISIETNVRWDTSWESRPRSRSKSIEMRQNLRGMQPFDIHYTYAKAMRINI